MRRFNPNDDFQLGKLREAVEDSREQLRPFRENQRDHIAMYAGSSYGTGSDVGEVIVNMMELAINTYQRSIAAGTPQVRCVATNRPYMPVASELSIASNFLYKDIKLGDTLNDIAYDTLFGLGIAKVGITPKEHGNHQGFSHDSGQPFCDPIALADWVHDMNASRWEHIDFAGNRYEVPYEAVMESPLFDRKGKRDLVPMMREDMDFGFERQESENPAYLSRTNTSMARPEYIRKVRLWDLWLPRDRLLVTLPAGAMGRPLRIVEWDGPERGPFHLNSFSKVPGSIMPLSLSMILENLNELINSLAFKAGNQADRQKTVLAGHNRAQSALESIVDTPDGMAITVDVDPNMIREFQFGGVDSNLMAAFDQFRQLMSYVGGNLDTLAGLGPSAETLGQDRLLTVGASKRLQDMQDRFLTFTQGICEDLAWYLWNDPFIELPLTKRITENIEIPFTWSKDSRSGEFFHYNFEVIPHSLQRRSPQEQLQMIMQWVQGLIIPLMPMLEAQGYSLDIEGLLKLLASYSNTPEMERMLRRDDGRASVVREGPVETKQSPVTTRNYVRREKGGGNGAAPEFAAEAQKTAQPRGEYKTTPSQVG